MTQPSVCAQHHPSRSALLARLRRRLPGIEVIRDPDPSGWPPSPWRTYRECLKRTPEWASHRVVIQDDAIPCHGFTQAAERAIQARPGRVICFYVGAAIQAHAISVTQAVEAGEHWCEIDTSSWIPVVAVSWPAYLVDLLLAETPDGRSVQGAHDDQVVGEWCRRQRVTPCATVPSLVQHRDGHRSLVGGPVGMRFREAVSYIGTRDASRIEW